MKTGYRFIIVSFFCLLGSAGVAKTGTEIEVTRLNDSKPILTRTHFEEVNASEGEASNINGPSVIRVPSWIPAYERPAEDANYYLYFAHHQGEYIRMAHAPTPLGPWRLFNTGEASDSSVGAPEKGVRSRATPGRGVLDLKLGASPYIQAGSFRARHHVASPDVRVDHANERLVLYFHAPSSTQGQQTFVATSRYGLNFNQTEDGGEGLDDTKGGVRAVIPGWFYFRTFEVGGRSFAYSNQARLYRAPAKTAAGEPANLANADEPGGLWNPSPDDDSEEYWELVDEDYNPVRQVYKALDRKTTDPRHFAVLHDPNVNADRIYFIYTSRGDKPEGLLLTEIDLTGLSEEERVDPSNWRILEPVQRILLEPEEEWEGGDLPFTRSGDGSATGVRELRDPFLFVGEDGEIYLYYTGRGEEAIGVASVAVSNHSADDASLPYRKAELLFRDDFQDGMEQWVPELQAGGTVEAENGRMEIDVPAGCTIWFRSLLEGPVMIEYEATVIDEGGPNDRVSDLNCFWMARDSRNSDDIFARERSGKFGDYHELACYYVGLGGHDNTRTRFRRYIGDASERPMLPEHDLTSPEFLIRPNTAQKIRLVAFDGLVQYFRDDNLIFTYRDKKPLSSGWFALRTVTNHMEIRNFRVHRLRER